MKILSADRAFVKFATVLLSLSCLDATAHVRFDYSIGPSSRHNYTVKGMHCDFWKDEACGRTRLVWFPTVDCVLESDHVVTNWAWGVSTTMSLVSFESDAGFNNLGCGILVQPSQNFQEFRTNAKGEVSLVTSRAHSRSQLYSVASANVDVDGAAMPEFLRRCEAIVRAKTTCMVMCCSGVKSVFAAGLRRVPAMFALYLGPDGNMSLVYSLGRGLDVRAFDLQYRDGQFYSSDGNVISKKFPPGGETVDFEIGPQSPPTITIDVGRRACVEFRSSDCAIKAGIRIEMDNILGLSDCLKAASQGREVSWRSKGTYSSPRADF